MFSHFSQRKKLDARGDKAFERLGHIL
jgi:hypothetical protein